MNPFLTLLSGGGEAQLSAFPLTGKANAGMFANGKSGSGQGFFSLIAGTPQSDKGNISFQSLDTLPQQILMQKEGAAKEQKDVLDRLLKALANSAYTLQKINDNENITPGEVLAFNQQVIDEKLLTVVPPNVEMPAGIQKNMILFAREDFRQALTQLQSVLKTIEDLIKAGDPALINTNLSVTQITALRTKIENVLGEPENINANTSADIDTRTAKQTIEEEDFAGIMAGLVQLLPPQKQPEIIIAGQSVLVAANALNGKQITGSRGENIAGLQNKNANAAQNTVSGQGYQALISKITARIDAQVSDAAFSSAGRQNLPGSFAAFLIDGEGLTAQTGFEGTKAIKTFIKTSAEALSPSQIAAIKAQGNNTGAPALPAFNALQAGLPSFGGSLLQPLSQSLAAFEELGLQTANFSSSTGSQFANLITQSQSAGQPHPATQQVAVQIQKLASAKSSGEKTMMLRLDPPDMGRVEIKMTLDKNNKMRAVLTAEKPETYLMLQRDSHNLERALQDVGIDSEDGLRFELADQQKDFSQDGSHDGSRNQTGQKDGDGEEDSEEIIESTVNWHINPETGHVHYNILA